MATSPERHANCQDLRVAVVMTGGVSLAVWISGATQELSAFAMARHRGVSGYQPLLDLVESDARVDVIAGTSAGGLNGAFLALGLSRAHDLTGLRALWTEAGSLDKLLRDPRTKQPPSLLLGDDYFLPTIKEALSGLVSGQDGPDRGGSPVELLLTGTLWQGRRTAFTDDMGAAITELDHDATFVFRYDPAGAPGISACGDLTSDSVVDELAAAARCTASFPAAFEPHWVEVGPDDGAGDKRRPSSAGRVNFDRSQYVIDGGVLLNKPIRPALQAVYRQTGEYQVRRLLAYVAPGPGLGEDAPVGQPGREAVPQASDVLLGVLTRLRATDSVSRELTEIRTRNIDARSRRRSRSRLAAAMTSVAGELSAQAWTAYREVRVEHAARTLAALLQTGGRWTEAQLVQGLRDAIARRDKPFFIPLGDLGDAVRRTEDAWDWGATTVQRLGDLTVDVLKRAVWLARMDSPERTGVIEARAGVAKTLAVIREDRRRLDVYWSTAPQTIPGYAAVGTVEDLTVWLGAAVDQWASDQNGRRALLYNQASSLARQLRLAADALAGVLAHPNAAIDPGGVETERLAKLHEYLLAPARKLGQRLSDRLVLERMLRLDVVQLAFDGATQEVEQEVELVPFTARHPECLTGMQLHHFGAFYRPSWRVNDWIHGRLDGAAHLVRILLAPERLRQLAGAEGAENRLRDAMRACVAPSHADALDRPLLEHAWAAVEGEASRYIADLIAGRVPDAGFLPRFTALATRPLHLAILRTELPELAKAIRSENDPPEASQAWLREWAAALAAGQPGAPAASLLSPQQVESLWKCAAAIGAEKIAAEAGGDTFARTASTTAAVAVSALGAVSRPRPVKAVLGALRGYTLAVWAMVTYLAAGRFGRAAVQITVAVGAALLALAIVVPGLPLALILTGVLLLLSGVSAAALLTPAGRGVGWRVALLTAVIAAALGVYLYRERADVTDVLVRAGVVLTIVLAGRFIATARPPAWQRRPADGRPTRATSTRR